MIDVPEETPIMLEDDEYSLEPTSDRKVLVSIMESLAEKISICLKEDEECNQRYARNILISNQTCAAQTRQASPGKRSRLKREEIPVVLPYEALCWNDYNKDAIYFYMLNAVRDVPEDFTWFNVRVHISEFISRETKEILDQESENEVENDDDCVEEVQTNISVSEKPPPTSRNHRILGKTPKKFQAFHDDRSRSPVERADVLNQEMEADKGPIEGSDDECMIVNIVGTPKVGLTKENGKKRKKKSQKLNLNRLHSNQNTKK